MFRDIRQENICVSANGYLKLVDFGNAKRLMHGRRARTLCGAPEYTAPEMLSERGHSFAVDWWALGVLMFELLVGHSPFASDNPMDTWGRILTHTLPNELWSTEVLKVSGTMKRFVEDSMLCPNEHERANLEQMKQHPLFHHVNWQDIYMQVAEVPSRAFIPRVSSTTDTSNFELYPQSKELPAQPLRSAQSKMEWRRWCSTL